MKSIEQQFEGRGDVKGITFTLIERNGLDTIWLRSDSYFEVVRLVERKAATANFNGNIVKYEAKEQYPQGESWSERGHGICLSNKEKAYEEFNRRVARDTKLARV